MSTETRLEYPFCLTVNDGCSEMNESITEQVLIDNIANGAVTKLRLVQSEDGNYLIYVTLTWKEKEQILTTFRKEPRVWANLDRLVKHIQTKYKVNGLPPIFLEI